VAGVSVLFLVVLDAFSRRGFVRYRFENGEKAGALFADL
jgi:hypothetical protein